MNIMQKVTSIFIVLIAAAGMSGCNGGTQPGKVGPRGYEQTRRVITFGDAMPMSQWNDPCVIKQGDRYVMFLTSNIAGKWKNVLPFRAESMDGIHWEIDTRPLLSLGKRGSFDSKKVETPSVVHFKGRYHMYYTGVGDKGLRGPLAIGHAISEDGIKWERASDVPVLKPTGNPGRDWNGYHVAEPAAVVFNNRVYLYFHASGARKNGKKPSNKSVIGLAISDDGHHFGRPVQVLEQGPRYSSDAPERYAGYSTPSALVVGTRLHLFYDVIATRPRWTQVALHHAVSSDGIKWKEDPEPFLKREDLSWTRSEVRAPTALYENGRFRVWFAGHDRKNLLASGIGLIEVSLPE
ncbi:hypothetical protein QVG61_04160 [Thiohalobacter sp. IOR34]|uniref:hypothetical protein n=1 Tax=Thiohalobacter sp. IOR34 TaxID=3057176 RepID=UPI0025B03067|nr:hypothetical protein [Thiohalobacter sp. IOR34]WJW76294.1 hypothetical protein QVG61_04160 [Thiohalobacter sp. IOR34]